MAGVSIRQYTTDATIMADCVARYYDTFRPDAVWLSADTWVTAEAMGARVDFPGDNQPMCGVGEPLVEQPGDIDRISEPDLDQGRWPLMLDALGRIRQQLGDQVFVVACFDQFPFSLACAAMGVDRLMLKLLDDRPFVTALLDKCSLYTTCYAQALGAAGADMLSGGDSPAGLLGPRLYRDVALPCERLVVQNVKARYAGPVSLHICGDTSAILADLAQSAADVLELDHQVDLATACDTIGPDVAIWGNVDPVSVLARGKPADVKQAAARAVGTVRSLNHLRFVLSSGCTLAMETPASNLHALMDAAAASATLPSANSEGLKGKP
jgi:MtaA/CmuA family methyltransferase